MQRALDEGESIKALRRFDTNLKALTLDNWSESIPETVLDECEWHLQLCHEG
jgi:hypothetical protein